jgi:geranylgeranyl diphosphate synthase type II
LDFEEYSAAHRPAIEDRLGRLLPPTSEKPRRLHEAMSYAVLDGGKRFRPLLCIAAANAVGATGESVLDAACSIEFVHCFSLIHDDLPSLDNDELRRGKPTCHMVFGEATAILAGDALFSLAFETLSSVNGDAGKVLSAIRELGRASGTHGMVGGQMLDMESESGSPSQNEMSWIHERKTGMLIAASCAIGAILGGGTDAQVEQLRGYGSSVGLCFQIADDILDETGQSAVIGKNAGADRGRNKSTYPAVFGMTEAKAVAASSMKSALDTARAFYPKGAALEMLAEYALERHS